MPERAERVLTPEEALETLRRGLAALDLPGKGRLEEDDFGGARYSLRMTLTQLDADEMNDRLQAFVLREVIERVPGASAGVSYHDARPDSTDESDLDVQEVWHDVAPVFKLEFDYNPPTPEVLRAWLAFLPRFHRVVAGSGRPTGFRDVHAGAVE